MASLLNNASLLLNPAGSIISYQEDKIYSVLPRNGAGDFTFSGGDGGTRVNQQGYIEVTPANLLSYSSNFSGYNSQGTFTSGHSDPQGGNTAFLRTSGNIWANQSWMQAGITYTTSVWLRSATGGNITVNLNDGASGNVATFTVTPEWKLYTHTTSAINSGGSFYLYSWSGNGYIWGPMINLGSTARPYQPTTDRLNYPRITYQNGRGALLSEPQRTNLVTYSQQFNQWNNTNCELTSSIATSPDGTQNAYLLKANSTANYHAIYQSVSITAGSTYYWSVFVKPAGGFNGNTNTFFLQTNDGTWKNCEFNLDNQTGSGTGLVGSFVEKWPNGWYRVGMAITSANTQTATWFIYPTSSPTAETLGGGYYIWGAQLEIGTYPTSYIPTTSATVTRPADIASNTNASSLIGQSAGAVYFDFTLDNLYSNAQTNQPVLWYMKDGGTGERYVELISGNRLVYVEYNGAVIADMASSAINTGRHKCAIAYANNDMVFYVDGVQVGIDGSGTPSGFSTVSTQYYNSFYYGQCKVHSLAPYTSRLSNTQLAELTTVRSGSGGTISYYGPYTIHTFTGSATFTPSFSGEVEVLVVAGGGGGGNNHAGGGGAGGLVYVSSYGVSAGSGITVTIGAGGASPVSNPDPVTNGSNSVFGGLTAIGGGGGGNRNDFNNNSPGGNGGSGGGGGGSQASYPGNWVPGNGIPGQGNNGGYGIDIYGGGGGGAGAVGTVGAASSAGGNGGNGLPYSISGFSTYYAGGGGGGYCPIAGGGNGGLGGGGKGGILVTDKGTPGVPYTGAGGGGGGAGGTQGSIGGAGIVIVRYLT